jgi:5-methylcytosine-specific restriction endonuclease McrA
MGQLHGPVSIAALMGLLCYVDWVGMGGATLFLAIIGIPLFLMTWAIRGAVRQKDGDDDNLTAIFEKAGLGGTKLRWRPPSPGSMVRSLKGVMRMPRGEKVPKDAQGKATHIEGGLGIPPGSLTIVPNEDRADYADVTLSDPRVLRKPLDPPDPSFPGRSIAAPILVGRWQDGAPANWPIVDQHVQIMGMTGSGKSLGAGWSTMAELITRYDVHIFAADITKGNQTLGPFADSIYRLETDKAGARAMLLDISAAIKPRTEYLASKGLAKWQEGCGLSYLVVWLEEAPDIIDSLGEAGTGKWLSSLKAARSAGISFFISLQRSDWTQLPTLARGQLAKWCFGVAEGTDANFGLSDLQVTRDATPELWGMRHPGMAYLDAPGIPEERVAMPMRTWYWGKDDKKIRQLTSEWPLTTKHALDSTTEDAMKHHGASAVIVPVDEPNGDVTDIEDEPGFDYTAPSEPLEPASKELASVVWKPETQPVNDAVNPVDSLRDFIITSKVSAVNTADLMAFCRGIGRTRGWLYAALPKLESDGLLERDETKAVSTWNVIGRGSEFNLERARAFIASSRERAEQYHASIDPDLTPESMLSLYESSNCYLCGTPIGQRRQIDHKTPLSKDGAHALENLGAACVFCNESKGDDTEAEYRARMDAV